MATYNEIIRFLKSNKLSKKSKEGMRHFGVIINDDFAINIPVLRNLAKKIGKNHELALRLWSAGYHDSMILASMIDDYRLVTSKQMDLWVNDFNSWNICDQCIGNLFDKTEFAYEKVFKWSKSDREYVKRAGFVIMAELAVHNKAMEDSIFESFFPVIIRESTDKRNFVKKAVNWALRQIGKRNPKLRNRALMVAREIRQIDSPAARWIASDAIRELEKR